MNKLLTWFKNLLAKIKGTPEAKPTTPPPVPATPVKGPDFGPIPPTKSYREIDLAVEFIKSRNVPGYQVTAYEVTWRIGRGMTQDEQDYARSIGVFFKEDAPVQPAMDRSGLDLGSGVAGPKVNGVIGGEWYSFTFDVADGQTAAEFRVMGSPGKFFSELSRYITTPSDGLVYNTETFTVNGVNHYELVSMPAPGKYTYHVKVNQPGMLAVEYRQK